MSPDPPLPAWAHPEASRMLPDLCARGEGQEIEFKERLPEQGHDIAKSIAAFASSNDGHLIFGVADDGRIVCLTDAERVEVRDALAQRIAACARGVNPPVRFSIEWACHQGKGICLVKVSKGDCAPYFSNYRPMIRVANISRPADPGEVEQMVRSRSVVNHAVASSPSSLKIGNRVRQALELMNIERLEQWTLVDLALAMKLRTPADLDGVVTGQTAASIELLDRFCERFAVNREWLIAGRRSPFASMLAPEYLPEGYLDVIDKSQPETVYAVRSRSPAGEAFFVIESDPFVLGIAELLACQLAGRRWWFSPTPQPLRTFQELDRVAQAVLSSRKVSRSQDCAIGVVRGGASKHRHQVSPEQLVGRLDRSRA